MHGEGIARFVHQHLIVDPAGTVPVALHQTTGRSRQAALALVGLAGQIFRRHHAGTRLRHEALLAEHHQHAGAEGVAQHELRRFRQRLVDSGDGIAHVRVVLP